MNTDAIHSLAPQEASQQPEKVFDPVLITSKIRQVLDGSHDYLDDSEGVNYDAIFIDGQEPFFSNIWNRSNGAGLGYIVFHDFLLKVSEGGTFSSTDMTPEGQKLFQKAVSDGLIEQILDSTGLHRSTRWKVISDPRINLEKIRSGLLETQKKCTPSLISFVRGPLYSHSESRGLHYSPHFALT